MKGRGKCVVGYDPTGYTAGFVRPPGEHVGRCVREIGHHGEAKNQSGAKDLKATLHATISGWGKCESSLMAPRQTGGRRILLFHSIPETVHSATVAAVVASSDHESSSSNSAGVRGHSRARPVHHGRSRHGGSGRLVAP